jgi:hypothetical protein
MNSSPTRKVSPPKRRSLSFPLVLMTMPAIEWAEVRLAGLDAGHKVRFGQTGEAGEVHQTPRRHRWTTARSTHHRRGRSLASTRTWPRPGLFNTR